MTPSSSAQRGSSSNWPETQSLLTSFASRTVVVIGDAIRDINITCRPRGISAETPTMVLEALSTETSLGGAHNVYRNLVALGASNSGHIYSDIMATKTRYWADGYKLLQVDTLPPREQVEIEPRQREEMWFLDDPETTVIVADYRHGLINEETARYIVGRVKGPLFVSSQVSQEESNHHWYSSDHTIFVMNKKEHACAARTVLQKDRVITKGEVGAVRYSGGASLGIKVTPIDTCGAGDAFLAAYALSGSLEFSNIWGGLSCLVKGANPPTLEMLEDWVKNK